MRDGTLVSVVVTAAFPTVVMGEVPPPAATLSFMTVTRLSRMVCVTSPGGSVMLRGTTMTDDRGGGGDAGGAEGGSGGFGGGDDSRTTDGEITAGYVVLRLARSAFSRVAMLAVLSTLYTAAEMVYDGWKVGALAVKERPVMPDKPISTSIAATPLVDEIP